MNTLFSISSAARMASIAALAFATVGCESLSRTPQVELYKPAVQAQAPTNLQPLTVATGSLYRPASYRPAFEDRRARYIGDILTIQIVENVAASQKQTSSVDKSSSTSSSITAFPFTKASSLGKLDVAGGSASAFEGAGGTESANTFSGSITATVVEVQPNGHLVVTGEKQIGVNQNVDVLRFSGTVDPRSVGAGSIVASTQVANVRVESRSRGQGAEAQIMPFIARFFLTLLPF